MAFTLDASIAAKWLLEDERSGVADTLLRSVSAEGASVPAIFPLELANVLLLAERRGRIVTGQIPIALQQLAKLELRIEQPPTLEEAGRHIVLAQELTLSVYDAAYLSLARREGATLLTSDRRLADAAKRAKVSTVFVP